MEHAKLVLKTVESSTINNATNSSFTWNNINMRTLLGAMYDKYDTFNLKITAISSGYYSNNVTTNLYPGTTNNTNIIQAMEHIIFLLVQEMTYQFLEVQLFN